MKKESLGFTLIELVTVITILGFLAATALPRYIDLREAAATAAAAGVAGTLESASSINHALDIAVEANLTTLATDPFYNVSNCIHAAYLLEHSILPVGYTIASAQVADKESEACVLAGAAGSTASFLLIGAANGIDP